MEKQGGIIGNLIKQIMKAYENYQLVFQKYDISNFEHFNDVFI